MSVAGNPAQWDDLFEEDLIPAILTLVIATWRQIEKPAEDAREDDISKRLYLALVKGKDRNTHAFLIRYQDVEVDDDVSKESGRKDIVFFPSLFDEPIYFCLEAKRLNALVSGQRKSLADEYVKEGMQRFVDRKYSRHVQHGGMLVEHHLRQVARRDAMHQVIDHHHPHRVFRIGTDVDGAQAEIPALTVTGTRRSDA